MIVITKAEKEAIREQFPKVHIVRTMKQKSKRHRYYCEETRQVMRFLNKLRDEPADAAVDNRNDKEGGRYPTRKTNR